MDLSALRVLVIDEVDFFFSKMEDSRTYPQETLDQIYEFCKDAASIA